MVTVCKLSSYGAEKAFWDGQQSANDALIYKQTREQIISSPPCSEANHEVEQP